MDSNNLEGFIYKLMYLLWLFFSIYQSLDIKNDNLWI